MTNDYQFFAKNFKNYTKQQFINTESATRTHHLTGKEAILPESCEKRILKPLKCGKSQKNRYF